VVKITPVRQRMLIALSARLAMLIIIAVLAEQVPAYGFIGNTPDYDDFRYEQGAVLYAEQAESVIDVDAFTRIFDSMEDWTGHHLSSPLTQGFLWYWIVCIMTYITKWRWWIRILNIVLSAFITKYIYELSEILFSERTARRAALFYAIFPYTVIFSCFSYKDPLVSFCIFFIATFFVKAKHGERVTIRQKIELIIVCLIFVFSRSGVSEIWIAFCLLYYYFEIGRRMSAKKMIVIMFLFVAGIVVLFLTADLILYKFNAYIGGASTEGLSGGTLVKITGLRDIWKLPFTFMFSILQPIGLRGGITSWASIVSSCNVLMCPIAISAIMEVIFHRRIEKYLSIVMLTFYLICSVSSVLIFRQLYSVWPIPMMYGINYLTNSRLDKKAFVCGTSVLLAAALILVLGGT
jgi:4-amino-4-deoxy-L-arabinose transferase-like glycosyltransferase